LRRQDGKTGAPGGSRPVRVGLVGCGYISDRYLRNARLFPELEIVACADATPERAAQRAAEYGVPAVHTVPELLADPEIEVVLNLTTPDAHASIAQAALDAGKGVYNEKPLAIALEDGRRLVETARARGLRLGAAPDTFLGGGLQTCRQLIDEGAIGEPVAATAFMLIPGHERWHPQPDFYYQAGGGPLFDMGPYYLTALISLLGPVRRVTGSARASFPERIIRSEPRAGERIAVEVPTHLAAVLDFTSGPIATLVTSFDVWASKTPKLEIYGSEGSLNLPDPNTFAGPVRIREAGDDGWRVVPVTRPYTKNSRGLGLADMAAALSGGALQAHRASGELAFHVLEVMHAVETASREDRHVAIASTCQRPAPLNQGVRGLG
jgi:predicted dehydrogenase